MNFIDITLPLDDQTLVYPGDPPFRLAPFAHIEKEGYSLQTISLCGHTGTHIDAPAHFVLGGATADALPLDILCGPALVLDARPAGLKIDAEFLSRAALQDVKRLLLRTTNEELLPHTFSEHWACLTEDGAKFLRNHSSVRLVGIDYLSIESAADAAFPVHHILLAAAPPILILEGIDLRHVRPGSYDLWCLPMKIRDSDGAPVRALLQKTSAPRE